MSKAQAAAGRDPEARTNSPKRPWAVGKSSGDTTTYKDKRVPQTPLELTHRRGNKQVLPANLVMRQLLFKKV